MAMKSVLPPQVFIFSQEEVNGMITPEVFMDSISVHRQGFNMRSIAKKPGKHRNTVKKYIKKKRKITRSGWTYWCSFISPDIYSI